ncbi:MAG TPA: peptide deformylase [Verrucomicrobiales bacterium]|nr:peptide deformylase [Verrucomicrobiales bacterium]
MIRSITLYPDPVLRVKCARVTEVTDEIRSLSQDLIESMIDADGVGLAAPQIGVPVQLAVVDVSHSAESISYLRVGGADAMLESIMPLVFINPELHLNFPLETEEEGCLSFPDLRARITRPGQLKATLHTLDGRSLVLETDGLLARAIQHETDHLNGVLFIDRMNAAAKAAHRGRLRRMKAEARA